MDKLNELNLRIRAIELSKYSMNLSTIIEDDYEEE
jgi:hypothetical protein